MRPSWIEVDLAAIRHNVVALAELVAPSRLCAVVKADAYGHGDVPVAETALEAGAAWLAVALVEEGIRLREAGIEAPILLLSEPLAGDAAEVMRWDLRPTVYRREFLDALESVATGSVPVHLKVDTGMHRAGADPVDAFDLARRIVASAALDLEGVWTHLSVAESDAEFTRSQIAALAAFVSDLGREGITPRLVHAANTPGAMLHPEARPDLVRAGIGIYGLRPAPGVSAGIQLQPAMKVISHVSMMRRLPAGARPSYGRIRPMPAPGTVVTVPIGYADGIPRRLAEVGGEALVGGQRCPFAGAVTMDQIVVDVGNDRVDIGDEVVILGRQGREEIAADEWAALLGTINYEVVCGFGPRLPRRYRS